MDLPLPPAFLIACTTDPASVVVARAYMSLASDRVTLMTVLIGDVDTIRSTFTEGVPVDRIVLLYDSPYSTAMRFGGKHRLPSHLLPLTPRWCIGIAQRLNNPAYKRAQDHCAEQLAAVFAQDRVRVAYEKLKLPWGEFPLKKKQGMDKPSSSAFRSRVVPS